MASAHPQVRLPDFVIVGAMKSATTSLFAWLGTVDGVFVPVMKEPHFFSRDDRWDHGLRWYEELFSDAPRGMLVGEASASYTDPRLADTVAERMFDVIPRARLIYVMRHPLERLRSHYRHEVQRSREHARMEEAVSVPGNPYVRYSLYSRALGPFLERFPREQVLAIRMEDLVGRPSPGWDLVLAHLNLPSTQRPDQALNVTEGKEKFTRPLLWLWERGLDRPLRRFPSPLRKWGRRMLLRADEGYRELLASSEEMVPEPVGITLREDVAKLEELLGVSALWEWS